MELKKIIYLLRERIGTSEHNILGLEKKEDTYVFVYEEGEEKLFLEILGRYAEDKERDFNWYDAAVLSQKCRKLKRGIGNLEGSINGLTIIKRFNGFFRF
jgi:hypothetical protein